MKLEHRPIELRGLKQGRVDVGDRLVVFRPPGEELFECAERWPGGVEFEGIFRSDQAAFARRRKIDRITGDHIPDRRPVGVGHFSGLDDRRPLRHRQHLQRLSFGAAGCTDGRGKSVVDFAHDRREIPRGDALEIGGICAAGGPLLKPPAVILKETPGPVGPNRLQHAAGLRR